jgi:hypothetical protein
MWDHELVAGVADYLEENLATALVAQAYTAPVAVHREYVDPYHLDHVPALVLQLLTYQYRQIDQIAGERRFVISVFGAGRPDGGQRESQILASAVAEVCLADETLGGLCIESAVTEREYYPSTGGSGADLPVFRVELVVICAQSE